MLVKTIKNRLNLQRSLYKPSYSTHLVRDGKEKMVGSWLFITAAGVLGLVVLGGYKRLTHSGLKMENWQPGIKKYPSDDEHWKSEFEKYEKYMGEQKPQKQVTLDKFKYVFRVEFMYRQIGIWLSYFYVLPLGLFIRQGYLTPLMRNRLLGILGLGILQRGTEWLTGANNNKFSQQNRAKPDPYKLAANFLLATSLYSSLLWHSFCLLIKPVTVDGTDVARMKYLRKIRWIGLVLVNCLLLNMMMGSVAAGIDAGKVYNTWPLINGAIVPKNLFDLHPKWKNFFENRALVQFIHRTLAYLTQGFALYMLYTVMKHQIHTPASFAVVVVFTLINYQTISGIVTLLGLVQPDKANLHQMSAMVTLSSAILLVYLCKVSLL